MIPKVDYHMHTFLCGHASGTPRDYAAHALSLGLDEIGFSDHAPFVTHEDPSVTMRVDQLPEYQRLIENVKKEFPQIEIKLGIEADFAPGYEEKTKAILEDYPYDYVIGSVHYLKDWAFDNPLTREAWNTRDVDSVYRAYFQELQKSAQSGLFDIMGHVDLVKKFGHRPSSDLTNEVEETARVFKECGVALEINTSGLRKPVGEIYPSLPFLSIYARNGVPIVFGSDAHASNEVGKDFDKAAQTAKEAGYKSYCVFTKRKIEKEIALD